MYDALWSDITVTTSSHLAIPGNTWKLQLMVHFFSKNNILGIDWSTVLLFATLIDLMAQPL